MSDGWSYEVHELSEGFSAIVYDEHGQCIADHLSEDTAALISAAPDLLMALKSIKFFGELNNVSVGHGWGSSGGKKPASKDVFAFPRHMLVDIDAAIAKAEGRS